MPSATTAWWSRPIATNSTRGPPRRSRRGRTSPDIVGGRDLQADGAWFAVDTRRRFGIVTNFREFGRRRRSAPSRGGLIPGYLGGTTRARRIPAVARDRRARATRVQPAARRPRIALVRVQSRRHSSRASWRPASMACPTNSSIRRGRSWSGCARASTRCCDRPMRDRPGRSMPRVCSTCSPTAKRRLPDTPAGRRPVARMGAQTLRAVRARPGLRHALLDRPHDLDRRARCESPNAASMPTARRAGQSEHVLNGADEVDGVRERARNPRARAGLSLESSAIPAPKRCHADVADQLLPAPCPRSRCSRSVMAQFAAPASAGVEVEVRGVGEDDPRQRARLSIVRALQELRRPLARVRRAPAGAQRTRGARAHCAPSASTNPRSRRR